MKGQILKNLRQVILGPGIGAEDFAFLELHLEEVGGEGMAADGAEQSLDVKAAVGTVVFHPVDAGVENLRLAADVQLVAADQGHQLAVREVEEFLLLRYLRGGVKQKKIIIGEGGQPGSPSLAPSARDWAISPGVGFTPVFPSGGGGGQSVTPPQQPVLMGGGAPKSMTHPQQPVLNSRGGGKLLDTPNSLY